jgi:hypothetical protein
MLDVMDVVGLLKGNDELVMYSAQLLGDRLRSSTFYPPVPSLEPRCGTFLVT